VECRALGIAHKTRGANRCFQILCSRRLKFDGFNNIRYAYLPSVLESGLSAEDEGFSQLGEGEPFRLIDGDLKLLSRESRAEPLVILAAQIASGLRN
jgi:hypothetical protein